MVEWLKKAPTALIVTLLVVVGVATLAYLAGYVFLTANGVDTTDYRALLNTAFNYVTVLLGATSTAAAVSAARSANKADKQTNGHLAAKDEELAGLRERLAAAERQVR